MRSSIFFLALLAGLSLPALSFAQIPSVRSVELDTPDNEGDLMAMLDSEAPPAGRDYTTATFKTTRIVNAHSVENVGAGVLDFRINHRFGTLNQGVGDFFGLDNAVTRIGFDYGITNWLMIGIGRSSYQKEYDGFIKARILRQTNDNRMPISVSYYGSASCYTAPMEAPAGMEFYTSNRFSYSNMLLIARKFSDRLSLQIMPAHLHMNLVPTTAEKNDVLALGLGGRIKLSRRIALTGEYFYTLDDYKLNGSRNSLSLGIDIETGGHVFQLHFTNATGMSERTYLGMTTGDWGNGDIHFGFNISRVFTVVKPKGLEGGRNKIW